jgi:hypothetical protein
VLNGHGDRLVTILAKPKDIDAGFELYRKVELSNKLGLSPYVFRIYSEVILPLLNPEAGLSLKEMMAKYYSIFHKTLLEKAEGQMIIQLEAAGLEKNCPRVNPANKK